MRTTAFRALLCATSILVAVALSGCIVPSVYEMDASAGRNGGFEIERSGLPVNWYFSRNPVTNANMEVSLDITEATEGNRALKIIVHRVEPQGGWLDRPWLFSSQPAKAGASYRVSFWLKNQGCEIGLGIRNEGKDWLLPSKSRKQDLAAHPPIGVTLGPKETGTDAWRQFEYIYAVPEADGSIRFELDISTPCTLWIDDMRVEEVHAD